MEKTFQTPFVICIIKQGCRHHRFERICGRELQRGKSNLFKYNKMHRTVMIFMILTVVIFHTNGYKNRDRVTGKLAFIIKTK